MLFEKIANKMLLLYLFKCTPEYAHTYIIHTYLHTRVLRDLSNNTWHFRGRGSTICHTNFFASWNTIYNVFFGSEKSFLKAILGFIRYSLTETFKKVKCHTGAGGSEKCQKVSRIKWMDPYIQTHIRTLRQS